MDLDHCSIEVVRSPFEVIGVQSYQLTDGAVDEAAPHQSASTKASGAAVGSRGVRQLVSEGGNTAKHLHPPTSEGVSLCVLTRHRKGQMLVWDAASHRLCAACDHGPTTSVIQSIVVATYIYTCIESDSGYEALETDWNVFVWDAHTLKQRFVLAGHTGRVLCIAVASHDPFTVASAGLDMRIVVWSLHGGQAQQLYNVVADAMGVIVSLTSRGGRWIAAGTKAPLGLWDIQSGRSVALSSTQQDSTVTSMYILSGSDSSKNGYSLSTCSDAPLSILLGTASGFVSEWEAVSGGDGEEDVGTCTLQVVWQNKLHRALVATVVADMDVGCSASSVDGVHMYHRRNSRNCWVTDRGSRSLVIDTGNKRIVVGADDGTVAGYNYAEFAGGSARAVTAVFVCRPHSSAVSGLFVEVAAGNVWERLLTCSIDGSISVFNYTLRGEARRLVSSTKPLAAIAEMNTTGNIALLTDSAKFITFANSNHVSDSAVKSRLKVGRVVSSIRWCDGYNRLLVASKGGILGSYTMCDRTGEWTLVQDWDFSPYSIQHMSRQCRGFVSLSLSKNLQLVPEGALAIVDVSVKEDPLTLYKLSRCYPVESAVMHAVLRRAGGCSQFLLIAARSDGGLQLFTALSSHGCNDFALIAGALLRQPYRGDSSVTDATAFGTFISLAHVHDSSSGGDPHNRYKVLYSEANLLQGAICSPNGEVDPYLRGKSFAEADCLSESIGRIFFIGQSGIEVVALLTRGAPPAFIAADGTPTHYITYDGDVVPLHSVNTRRRSIVFPGSKCPSASQDANVVVAPLSGSDQPQCCAVAFNAASRYIVFGYEDGLIQLVDTTFKYVFARLWVSAERPVLPDGLIAHDKFVIIGINDGSVVTYALKHRILLNQSSA